MGEPISWEVIIGGGSLDAASTTTDGDGRAGVRWTLGTEVEHLPKVQVQGGGSAVQAVYVFANTDLRLEPRWTSGIGEYYPMFGLAVRYLLDEEGLGRTLEDVKGPYRDMRSTVSFRESFESFIGISVEEYEADFYELMVEYLG